MKLALIKTCFLVLSHLIAQKDTFSIANDLYNNKQYKESIGLCTSQLSKRGLNDTLYEKFLALRSGSYLHLHEYLLGIKDYKILIKLRPKKIEYYVGLSYLYGENNQYENCINILHDALNIQPNNIYTLDNLAYYSGKIGNNHDAIKYANEGLKYAKESIWKGALLNNRGFGYIGLKRYKEALSDINQAIVLDPDNSFAYCYRALTNIGLNDFDTVCSDLDKAKNLGAISLTKDLIVEYCAVHKK